MNAIVAIPPAAKRASIPMFPLYRLSVEQYHRMAQCGILPDGEPVELIDGYLVSKMSKNPPHVLAAEAIREILVRIFGQGWTARSEAPVTLGESEPEPDVVMARGRRQDYAQRHPGPADLGVLVEVADSTLSFDRGAKKRSYAAERVAYYWLVNLVDRQIEVYTQPAGTGESADYQHCYIYGTGRQIPVVVDGTQLGEVTVSDVLP